MNRQNSSTDNVLSQGLPTYILLSLAFHSLITLEIKRICQTIIKFDQDKETASHHSCLIVFWKK